MRFHIAASGAPSLPIELPRAFPKSLQQLSGATILMTPKGATIVLLLLGHETGCWLIRQ